MTAPNNLKYIYDVDITVSKATFLVLPCSPNGDVIANVKQPISGVYDHAVFSGANKAGTIKVCGSKKSKQRIVIALFATNQLTFRKALKELTAHIASEAKPTVCFPLMREEWQRKAVEEWATANSTAVIRVVSSSPESVPDDEEVEEVDASVEVEEPEVTDEVIDEVEEEEEEPKATPKAPAKKAPKTPVVVEEEEQKATPKAPAKKEPKATPKTPVVEEEEPKAMTKTPIVEEPKATVSVEDLGEIMKGVAALQTKVEEMTVLVSRFCDIMVDSTPKATSKATQKPTVVEDDTEALVEDDDTTDTEALVEDDDVVEEKPSSSGMTLLDFTRENSPPDWGDFFEAQLEGGSIEEVSEALEAEVKAGNAFYPPLENVYEALTLVPPTDIKVVIIGQDPYHDDGQAMGLAFSVPDGVPIPSSLQNIFKELKNDGFTVSKSGDLSMWAIEGVLLINAALTVRAHQPNSHSKMWKTFTEQLFRYINEECDHVVVIMWGNEAQKYDSFFDGTKHKKIKSAHPSGMSANKGFLGSKPFSKANELLEKMGLDVVDWNL